MTRLGCVLLLVSLVSSASAQEAEDPAEQIVVVPEPAPTLQFPLHPHREQRDKYLWSTFGPPALLEGAVTAGLQQWRDVPHEWGQSDSGYLKRFAAEYAESAISGTTKYVVSRLRDEDPSFHVCHCSGVGRRLTHAIVSPFIARKPDGRTVFSFARIAGTTATTVVSSAAWRPTPQTPEGQIKHIGIDLLGVIGVDVLREFILHRHQPA